MRINVRGLWVLLLLIVAPTFLLAQSFDSLLNELTGGGDDQGSSVSAEPVSPPSKTENSPQEASAPSEEGALGTSESLENLIPSPDQGESSGVSEGAEVRQPESPPPSDALPPVPTGPLPPSSLDIMSTLEEEEETVAPPNIRTNGVVLQGLDKTTARVFITRAPVGQEIEFGDLKITVQRCEKTPPELRPDSMAFVTITEVKPNCPARPLFSGWMFASSPSLSALDHPLYDVWIKECRDIKKRR